MKFTAFVLATAAATASAQVLPQNPYALNSFNGFNGNAYNPYPVNQPYGVNQLGPNPYPIAVPQVVDPLAWERDCTWVNSIGFRQSLSMGTCGARTCDNELPNGNGGGHARAGSFAGNTAKKIGYNVWGSVINRAGRVCAVAYTGSDITKQFPYGRILSMKLANTANALSLPNRAAPSHIRHSYPSNNRGLIMNGAGNPEYSTIQSALLPTTTTRTNNDQELEENASDQFFTGSTPPTPAGSYTAVTPANAALGPTITAPREFGSTLNPLNSLWPLSFDPTPATFTQGTGYFAESQWFGFTLPAEQFNPGNVDVHYQGATSNYGEACGTTRQDPMCMQKPGGFTYQAGGLPLYDQQGVLRGAIGVAGDNDCTNHAIAWKTREQMFLMYTPCSTTPNERNDMATTADTAVQFAAAVASNVEVHWAGKFSEDNVIFSHREQYLFPECQNVIRQFATSNPTVGSTFGENSCSK